MFYGPLCAQTKAAPVIITLDIHHSATNIFVVEAADGQ